MKENRWELSKFFIQVVCLVFFFPTKQHGKNEVEMVNEQIGSGFKKAWFLGSKGFVSKAVYDLIYRCPRYPWVWVNTGNFLLPKPWGAQGVTAGESARHGQLSHCQPLTWGSPDACTGQCRACSGDSQVLTEEPTPLECTGTHRSEGGKKSKSGGCAGDFLFPLDDTDVWAAVLLGKEPAVGKMVLFSPVWIDSATFPLLLADQFLPIASGCPPTSSLPCQWSDTSFCYLLKAEYLSGTEN